MNPKDLPLLEGLKRVAQDQGIRCDANETHNLERVLTYLRSQVETVDKDPRDARKFMPFATDIPATASTVAYRVNREIAKAKVTAQGANDAPRVDINSFEVTFKIHEVTASFGWTNHEIAEAARVGRSLAADKAMAASSTVEDGLDEMLAFGRIDPQNTLACTGLINNADVISQGIINPDNDPWAANTDVDLIIADVMEIVDAPTLATKGLHKADTLLMPLEHYLYLKNRRLGDNNDTTLLKYILDKSELQSIAPWHLLKNAGAGGTTNRFIAYKRDPLILEGVLPMEFTQLPPQAQGFEQVIFCMARCGGVLVKRPLGMKYGDVQNLA